MLTNKLPNSLLALYAEISPSSKIIHMQIEPPRPFCFIWRPSEPLKSFNSSTAYVMYTFSAAVVFIS